MLVENKSGFDAKFFTQFDKTGMERPYIVVKGEFFLDPSGNLIMEQNDDSIIVADEHYGDPLTTSIKHASDIALHKPATDVVLIGSACAPQLQPVKHIDVHLQVSNVSKSIRVFGNRVWLSNLIGATKTDPLPFTRMPLQFERAFGGWDISHEDPTRHDFEAKNPVGQGFMRYKSKTNLENRLLPNLEDPQNLIEFWNDRPRPMGFGCIARGWQPRLSFGGTYDAKWEQERLPLVPDDFDYRFNHTVSSDQVTSGYLQGNEKVSITNVTPDSKFEFSLPGITIGMTVTYKGRTIVRFANLDTLIIEPEDRKVSLVWRCILPVKRKVFEVKKTLVFPVTLTAQRILKHFKLVQPSSV